MPYCWALLLVTLETLRRSRVRASSKANRMIRSQPAFGEQGRLHGDLTARQAPGEVPAARADVLALAVLPDDDPVQVGVVGPLSASTAQRLRTPEEVHLGECWPTGRSSGRWPGAGPTG